MIGNRRTQTRQRKAVQLLVSLALVRRRCIYKLIFIKSAGSPVSPPLSLTSLPQMAVVNITCVAVFFFTRDPPEIRALLPCLTLHLSLDRNSPHISLRNVDVLSNPSHFKDPFRFEITFECLAPLEGGAFEPGIG